MSRQTQKPLEASDQLPANTKHTITEDALRGLPPLDSGPLQDE
jgi:hypothetical protein